MALRIEKRVEERIIIMHYSDPFNGLEDLPAANQATAAFIEEAGSPVFRIENVTDVTAEFKDVVEGAMMATRSGGVGSLADDRVKACMVGQYDLAELAATAMGQEQYGAVDVPLFKSLDEAIEAGKARLQDA